MIYFDNAATGGRKPDAVLTAVSAAVKVCANPGRSGHQLSLACARLVEDCRHAVNDFFEGESFERVIFTKNCTEALNIALFGVLKKGDHVIVSCMEHNSVLRPLEHLKNAGLITYDVCPLDQTGNISPQAFASLVKPNTKMAILTAASNVTGTAPPLDEIRRGLPARVLLLCDGAQGGGHLPLSMQKLGIDLLAIAGHKGMLGIQGSGALLFSSRVQPSPILYGGTGSMSISLDMPDFFPDRLEAGTLSFPAVVSLLEGTRYLTVHADEVRREIYSLTDYFLRGLGRLKGYRAYSRPNPCGIVAFSKENYPAEYLADELSRRYQIALRGGLHCAPFMHEALGTLDGGLARVSFSHFNKRDEIDELLAALKEME